MEALEEPPLVGKDKGPIQEEEIPPEKEEGETEVEIEEENKDKPKEEVEPKAPS